MNKEDLKDIKLFLFDLDGTLYLGERLFDFTTDLLAAIRRCGAQYLFMTNNSSKSVSAYIEKLARLGIAATYDDFITSSQATAYYLHGNYPDAKLYVCGTKSLRDELAGEGFCVTDSCDDATCVVIGYDTELTYKKLEDVCRILLARDVPYIATNPDYVCPTEFGSLPDCGSICDMIENATGKRPLFIGKPAPLMLELAMKRLGVSPLETAVVGDRIYTDIKSGINAGTRSVLVMSGETDAAILAASADKPDLVLSSAGEILAVLR